MKPEIKLEYRAGGPVGDASELIIRKGQALPLKEPQPLRIVGVLDSPLRWLEKRIETLDQLNCNIIVNRNDLRIVLRLNERDHYQDSIAGGLELHPMFKKFAINTDQYLSNFEMATLFKMNRSAFENHSVAMNLVTVLQNFRAKVDKEIERVSDNRGNTRDLKAQAVESNLPDRFKLCMPIFKGMPKITFEVEVYIKPEDFSCTLISPESNDLIEDMRDGTIDAVLDKIREVAPAIVIIEQ